MSAFAGVGRLARLALRRDRIQLPLWLAGLPVAHIGTALSVLGLYPDAADRVDLARSSAKSAVALGFNGLVSGTSEGAIVMSQTFLPFAVGAALMSTFAVVRHTRQNEQTGRAELVGASGVGRHAQTTAALVLGGFAAAAFGLFPGHATAVSWSAFACCLLLGQVGDLLGLPAAIRDLSRFTHLPAAPVEAVMPGPLLVLLSVAAALTALGLGAFRRRDLGS